MKIAVYARVSTDSADQCNSLENQKSYFERATKDKKCKLIKIYADAGLTGTKLNNRPEFNQMLKDAGIDIIETYTNQQDKRLQKKHVLYEVSERVPLFSEIWIKNTSRFARNTLSFDIISKLRAKGVHIRFLEQNICTADIGADFLLKLFQLFDEQDSRDKSLKVRTGQKEGALKGKINASSKLYGYTYNQPQNRLDTIESESLIIRKIFNMYADGMGIRRIINDLTSADILTRDGKSFCKSSIRRILTNEKYAGINARMKYDTGFVFTKNSYAKVKPKSEWLIVDTDKIPAIIDSELFYQCEQILEGRVNHTNQVGIYKGTTEYAGLIYCGVCGASYNSNIDRGRRYYNCSTKKRDGISACNSGNLSIKALEEILTPEFYYQAKTHLNQFGIDSMVSLKAEFMAQLANTQTTKIAELQAGIEAIEGEEKSLLSLCLKKFINEDEFGKAKLPLANERELLTKELQALTTPKANMEAKIAEIDSTVALFRAMVISNDTPREDIINDIEKIIVGVPNVMQVKFKTYIDERKLNLDAGLYTIKYEK